MELLKLPCKSNSVLVVLGLANKDQLLEQGWSCPACQVVVC